MSKGQWQQTRQFEWNVYNIFLFAQFLITQRRKNKMSGSSSSQSEATYPHPIKEKPPIEVLLQNIQSAHDQQSVSKLMIKLADYMRNDQQSDFETGLKGISFILEKGYSSILMTYSDLMRKMMNYFTKLGKCLEDQTADYNIEVRMLYVLSIIAELIRQNPKFYFPFTRKFLMTMFRIDNELLIKSPKRKDILAILAVIYENLSRQGRLVNKYKITNDLKRALLQNYELIEELFTLKVFNKTITNLVTKGVSFSVADFTKFKLLETLSNFISKSEVELFVVKMKMTMLLLKGQGQICQGINHSNQSAFCMTE